MIHLLLLQICKFNIHKFKYLQGSHTIWIFQIIIHPEARKLVNCYVPLSYEKWNHSIYILNFTQPCHDVMYFATTVPTSQAFSVFSSFSSYLVPLLFLVFSQFLTPRNSNLWFHIKPKATRRLHIKWGGIIRSKYLWISTFRKGGIRNIFLINV